MGHVKGGGAGEGVGLRRAKQWKNIDFCEKGLFKSVIVVIIIIFRCFDEK